MQYPQRDQQQDPERDPQQDPQGGSINQAQRSQPSAAYAIPPGADFGPAGYDPAAVDAFVTEVAERLDQQMIEHLRVLAEIDALRTKLCEGDTDVQHSVHRLPAGTELDQEFEERAASAAHVIRTQVDTAHRRSARLISDAEVAAKNIVDKAKRDAACAMNATRAQTTARLLEAQASADRILQAAHQRATEISAEAAMARLDRPSEAPRTNPDGDSKPAWEPGAPDEAPTDVDIRLRARVAAMDIRTDFETTGVDGNDVDDELAGKQERTFEALWHAAGDEPNRDIERYFRPRPFKVPR